MKNLFLAVVLLSCFIFSSCNKDRILMQTSIVETNQHCFELTETNSSLDFSLEIFSDTTDNLLEDFPSSDFIDIAIDANQNGQIDPNVDFGFSTIPNTSNELCSYFFLEGNALTPCGDFPTTASINGRFDTSDKLEQAHIIWDLSIPKDDLPDNSSIHLVVKIFGDDGYNTLPMDNENAKISTISFRQVLTIELSD